MHVHRDVLIPLGLSLVMGGTLAAQERAPQRGQPESPQVQSQSAQRSSRSSQDSSQNPRETTGRDQAEQVQTIRGSVVGVTSIGEAIVDPAANRATVAEVDYLTVLGKPVAESQSSDSHNSQGSIEDSDASNKIALKVLDQVASAGQGETTQRQEAGGRSAGASRAGQAGVSQGRAMIRDSSARNNIYLIALTPETQAKCCVAVEHSDSVKSDEAGQTRDEQSISLKEALGRLEIGDEVEVEFVKAPTANQTTAQSQGQRDESVRRTTRGDAPQQNPTSNADLPQASSRDSRAQATDDGAPNRHGRERAYRGKAICITLLSSVQMRQDSPKATTSPGGENRQNARQTIDANRNRSENNQPESKSHPENQRGQERQQGRSENPAIEPR